MPKGIGSISVRPDGKADAEIKVKEWYGTVPRHCKRLPSREAAERWLIRVRYEHERNMLPSKESERLTLGEYLTPWLDTVSRHTYRDYQDKVRLHIAPVRQAIHVTLSKALHDAEGADLVRKNVARFARPPKDKHTEKAIMSVAEAMLFLEAIRGLRAAQESAARSRLKGSQVRRWLRLHDHGRNPRARRQPPQ